MPAQSSKTITLFSSKKSDYKIVLEDSESSYERRALEIIQTYLEKVSGRDFKQKKHPDHENQLREPKFQRRSAV